MRDLRNHEQLLTDIARVRENAPYFVASLEAYFEALIRRETGFLTRPTVSSTAARTNEQLRYALGLREGLLRGRLILDSLEQYAREALSKEQKNATATAPAVPGGPPRSAAPTVPATGPRHAGGVGGNAPTGVAPLPDWVGTR